MKKLSSVVTAIAAGALFLSASTSFADNQELKTDMQKVSYTIGYDIGKGFKQQDVNIEPKLLLDGLTTGLKGEKAKLSTEDMQKTMQKFQKDMMEKAMKQQEKQAEDNEAKSQKYLDNLVKNAKKEGIQTIKPGLYYKVEKKGTGPVAGPDDTVVVNYEGKLINGTVFDSSFARNKPASFRVDQVIPGWTEALQKMPQGSTWTLYIAPKLAYGKFAPPKIGPNQALIFKVDLLKVQKAKAEQK